MVNLLKLRDFMSRTLQGLQAAQDAGDDQMAQHFSGLADKANAAAEQALRQQSRSVSQEPPAAPPAEDLKIQAIEQSAAKPPPHSMPLDMPPNVLNKIQANVAPQPTDTGLARRAFDRMRGAAPPFSASQSVQDKINASRQQLPPEAQLQNLRAEVKSKLATQFPFGLGDVKEMAPGMLGSLNGEQLLKQLETGSAKEVRAAADALLNRGGGKPVPGTITGLLGLKQAQPDRKMPDEINVMLKEMEGLEKQMAPPPPAPVFPHRAEDEKDFLGPPTNAEPALPSPGPDQVVGELRSDPKKALTEIKSLVSDPAEQDFLARVEQELGREPKFFTLENLAVLLLFGAKGVMQKWMAERQSYQSGKSRIGREMAYERRAEAKERQASGDAKAVDEKRDRQLMMTLADKSTRNRLRAIDKQIQSIEKDISRKAFQLQGSKPEDITAALAPLEEQRATLQAAYNEEVERSDAAMEDLIEKRDKK